MLISECFGSRPRECPAEIEAQNLKVIVFNEKQDDWKFWEVKFLARARRKGFKYFLERRLSRRTMRNST